MKKQLIILGAGGYAKQVYWTVCRLNSHEVIGFLDETIDEDKNLYDHPVRNNLESLLHLSSAPIELISAVGNANLRKYWHDKFDSEFDFATIVDPTSIVAPDAIIGKDVVILAFTVCSCSTIVGKSTNINWHCTISHDVKIGDYTNISSNVQLAGRATVGNFSQIGTGACLIPDMRVGNWSVIGAGAVVTKEIPDNVLAVGLPAIIKKSIKS
jgi:acetyltransferase EpsM